MPPETLDPAQVVAALRAVGVARRRPVAVTVAPGVGLGLAAGAAAWAVPTRDPAAVVAAVEAELAPRWVWWRADTVVPCLVAAGVRLQACWDLGAVHQLVNGGRWNDPAHVWADVRRLPAGGIPPPPRGGGDLFDLLPPEQPDGDPAEPVRPDGYLRPDWAMEPWSRGGAGPEGAAAWAALALAVHAEQEAAVAALPDGRLAPMPPMLPVFTAYAESAAALLAVELAHDGLPVDVPAAERLIAELAGRRPTDEADAAALRRQRDDDVLRYLPDGVACDLRNPAQVRDALARLGFSLPDTRSWRLEPFRGSHPFVDALLAWRKAERIATTYGYGWLDAHVGTDGRLRGAWTACDGGAGRMTAQAGLHSLPAELRPAVAAGPGRLLVRADLGQVEPRVLAVVSGDRALAAATADDDLYAPVARQLGCDRPTAKVAVLAAMYGQTSGAAGAALRRMEAAYPRALAYLRSAEESGRTGRDVRTWGGRRVRVGSTAGGQVEPGVIAGRGRFARNAVVQGAAAELFKAWAAAVRAGLPPLGGRIVLCLHDELLLEVPAPAADAATALLTRALGETAARWAAGAGVRFVADTAVVHRWSDAKG